MTRSSGWLLSILLLAGLAIAQNPTPEQPQTSTPAVPDTTSAQPVPAQEEPTQPGTTMSQPGTPQPGAQASAPTRANKIPAGTVIPAELSKSIDAKKAKQGDPVEAKVAQDLLSNGQVIIPRGSKITGHVTTAKPHDKSDPSSNLGIAFDQIDVKDKGSFALQASIQALAKPVMLVSPGMTGPAPDTSESPSSGTSGAAAGGMGRTGASQGAAQGPVSTPSDASAGSTSGQPAGTALSAQSQGAVGMEGITLSSQPQGTLISSAEKNVKLDSGTQLILRAN